jgi:hypothetical protein
LKALCQLVRTNTLEKHENSRKLDKGGKIFLRTGSSGYLNYPLYLYFLGIMCLYRGACDYGSLLIIVVFRFKSCLSRLIFFMSLLRCAVGTLFSLGKNYVRIGFSLCVLWDRHCGQRGVY